MVAPASTPLRALGELTSGVAILVTLFLLMLPDARRRRLLVGNVAAPLGRVGFALLASLALIVLLLKVGLVDRTENPFRAHRFDGRRVPGTREAGIDFGGMFTLYGYDLPSRPVPAGQPLAVHLYLGARREVDGEYLAYARLVDGEGRMWSKPDNGTPEGFRPPPPTSLWPTDAYAHWAYLVHVLPGTPPGEYWVQVGIFERGTWRGLNVLDEEGRILSLAARLGPVRVVRPRCPPDIDALGMGRVLRVPLGPDLECLGSAQEKDSATVGEELPITLFWRAVRRPRRDYALRLALVGGGETFVLGDRLPLGQSSYPTGAWVSGEIVRSIYRPRIPAAAMAGEHRIVATLLDETGNQVAPPLTVGLVRVKATDRLMALPEGVQHRLDVNLGDRALLVGYDLSARRIARGHALDVTLYWQAQREMEKSYKVFVQIVGAKGVLCQVDAVPVAWKRPTTGWLPGEVIVDAYTLDIPADAPAGRYELIAGMYDERSLHRLAVSGAAGAGDHVTLGEVIVE